MTRTIVTIYTMWHIVITIDVAISDGIQVVVLGDVSMGDGIQGVILGNVAMGMVVIGLRWFVRGSDVVVGKWHGDGRALVIGSWSLLLLGPWQPRPVQEFRGQEGEGNGQGDSPGGHGCWGRRCGHFNLHHRNSVH